MHSMTVLAFLLGGFSPAAAQAPVSSTATFELIAGGALLGSEEATRTATPEGATLSGTVQLTFPGGGRGTLTQDLRLAVDGRPTRYTLDIDAPGQQFVVMAIAKDAGYELSITPRGADTPRKTESVPVTSPVFILDNNFASHLETLTRSLRDLGVGHDLTITALVPQALMALPATIHRSADGTAMLSGASVATRNYAVTIANVREEIIANAADGMLLQVSVPLQGFVMKRKGFAPTPAAPAVAETEPRERGVDVQSAAGPLPAILLMPKAQALVPGVVFLSGSGPNDRDETIGPNKPFRDVARALGDRGIASLRFDKRTHAIKDPAKLQNVTLKDEYYDDAAVAIAQLRATAGVDPNRIFVLGHSEGAMIALKVAAADPAVRGAVLMAPGVRPIDVMLVDQMAFGAKLTGRSDADVAEQTQELQAVFAAIRDTKRTDPPPFMGAPATYWREVLALDVPAMVIAAKIPLLVLQGDKDIQVRKDLDFDVLRAKAGTADGRITYRSFPDLNHLFMKVERASTGAEYGLPGHVDPAVVAAIADWILAR